MVWEWEQESESDSCGNQQPLVSWQRFGRQIHGDEESTLDG